MNKQPSIMKNYFYNTALSALNFIFPLITFPYVARLLGPEGIGRVNYANNIVTYFIIIASLGIPAYGIKEISKVRNDRQALNKVFTELFILSTLTTVISALVYGAMFLFVDKFKADPILYMIFGSNLILNIFAIDWLFQGIENYGYITLRSFIFKLVSLVLTFVLIQNQSDYLFYAAIIVFAISGANILNIIHSRKLVSFDLHKIDIKPHLKPVFLLLGGSIIASVYKTLSVVLLGAITNDDSAVGFFTTNMKIIAMAMAIIISLTNVLIPRMSYYLNQKMKKEYNLLATRSVNFIFFLSLPAIVLLTMLSRELLFIFGGEKFLVADLSLKLVAVVVATTPLNAFFGFHILLPNNQEKKMVIANIVGAVLNIAINLIFIPMFSYNATSAAFAVSDVSMVVTQYILTRKYVTFPLVNKQSLLYLIGSVGMLAIIIGLRMLIHSPLILFISAALSSSAFYLLFLFILKDEFIIKGLEKGRSILFKVLKRNPDSNGKP